MANLKIEKILLDRLRQIVRSYAQLASVRVQQEWSKYNLDGESNIIVKMEEAQAIVTAHIYAWGQKAWLLEFGKGSQMETRLSENPFLFDYIDNDNFNRFRLYNDYAITGRSKGDYYDLDGYKHTSSGRAEGENLEELAFEQGSRYEKYLPFKPKRIIKNILIGENEDGLIYQMQAEFQDAIRSVYIEIINRFTRELKII